MNKHKNSVSLFHVVLLFIMSVGLMNHVIIIPALMDVAKRDAWVSVLVVMAILSIWVWIISYVAQGTKQANIFEWMKQNMNKRVASTVIALVCLFLVSGAAVTMTDLTKWTNITYLPVTPQIVIVLLFVTLCFLAASTSLVTITIANGILLPFVILLGYFVFSANLPEKEYQHLFPLFEHGYGPMLHGMVFSAAGIAEVVIIIFLQHRVKTKIRYTYLVLLVFILGYLTIGPVTGSIAAFGPEEAAKQRFPAYELWSLVTLGRFLEHVDFFSIYQWLSGGFIRISLALYIIVDLLHLQSLRKRIGLLAGVSVLIICCTLLPISDMQFITILSRYVLPISLLFLVALSIFLCVSVLYVNRRSEVKKGVRQ